MADQPDVSSRQSNDSTSSSGALDYAKHVLGEFASSAWDAGVANKYRGVTQLFGEKTDQTVHDPHLQTGMMRVAHVAGTALGQIGDLAVESWAVGKAFNALRAGREATQIGSLLTEGSMSRSVLTGTTVGLLDGGVFTPVGRNESQWQRLGNAATEAGTFATLNGMTTRIGTSLGTNLFGRIQANALSGFTAGMVDTQLDSATHGHGLASAEDTIMGGAGWAVGNVAFGEGARALGKVAGGTVDWFKGTNSQSSPEALTAAVKRDLATVVEVAGLPKTHINVGDASDLVSPPAKATPAESSGESRGERVENGVASTIKASETVSMSDLTRKWGLKSDQALPENASEADKLALEGRRQDFQKILDQYYDHFESAFPLPGEIESKNALRDRYLLNGKSSWDMVILRDENQNVLGGIHYQIVDVPDAEVLKKVAWAEHIFLRKDGEINARAGRNFMQLKNIASNEIGRNGGEFVVMEFNNPLKMTPEQRAADAAAGLGSTDRLWVWGRSGIHVPVDTQGNMPEYGQPDMDKFTLAAQAKKIQAEMQDGVNFEDAYKKLEADADPERLQNMLGLMKKGTSVEDAIEQTAPPRAADAEPEEESDGSVRFLNMGLVSLKPLTGRMIPTSDINKVARALHKTIPTVDVDTDPTVKWYSEHNDNIQDKYLTMVPLTAVARALEAAEQARVQSMAQSVEAAIKKAIQSDLSAFMKDMAARVDAGTSYLSPQEQAALPDAIAAAAKAAYEQRLKK